MYIYTIIWSITYLFIGMYIMCINTYVCIENGFIAADIWAMCVYNISEAQRLQTMGGGIRYFYIIICVYEGRDI